MDEPIPAEPRRWGRIALVTLAVGGLVALQGAGQGSWPLRAGHALLVLALAALALRPRRPTPGRDAGGTPVPTRAASRTVLFQCMEDTRAEVAEAAHVRSVRLQLDYITPMPVTIDTDAVLLESALADVLRTAIHSTRQGTVLVMAYCWREEGQLRLELVVMDGGSGMNPTELRGMFQEWHGVDSATDERRLARAARTAIQLGGNLEVGRWPGIGTVYRLDVPAGADDGVVFFHPPQRPETEPAAPEEVAVPPLPPDESLAGLRVLVVDDIQVNRRLLEKILTRRGAEVTLARNGREGSERCLASIALGIPFDAILMDIHMPEMDGYEATSRIRAGGYVHPILAVTADAALGGREDFLLQGFTEHIPKPIDRNFLVSRLRSLCGLDVAEPTADPTPAAPPPSDRGPS